MQTTTTTGISLMDLTMSERPASSSNPELMQALKRAARRTDWDGVIAKADRGTSIAGAAVLIAALLYFAPIFVSILVR